MIRIVSLVENTSDSKTLKSKHGLSLYIETDNHKVLFDVGPDSTFLENAGKLGIDLTKVDTVIISHGHYDHGGGLADFLQINKSASVYIRRSAYGAYYTRVLGLYKYIGLNAETGKYQNIIFTDERCSIDRELTVFSGVTKRRLFSSANDSLCVKRDNKIFADNFDHEQYLVITDGENQAVITGCSHTGIVNIMEKFAQEYKTGKKITIIGGFHLYNPAHMKYESDEDICKAADELSVTGYSYYTCHCTGKKAYQLMKDKMKDSVSYFSTGKELIIQ